MAALEHSRSLLVEAFLFIILSITALFWLRLLKPVPLPPLRFKNPNGQFKILQVADMHYADGQSTKCLDVFPSQFPTCSDLNTTAFVKRMITAEQPDLIVFTGDNIFGADTKDPATSLKASFEPVISAKLPWAAVLGNHDQESILTRKQVMEHIVPMDYTLSKVNPHFHGKNIDGFGNYNLEVKGMKDSELEGKSVLNLYFLDSGDYSTDPNIPGYGWIKPSQQAWFKETSAKLQDAKIYAALETKHFVLVHGGGFGAWCWYKTIALLEEISFKATAIDLTGCGIDSTDPNKIATLAQYAKPLTEFFEKLGDEEKDAKLSAALETTFCTCTWRWIWCLVLVQNYSLTGRNQLQSYCN